MLEVPWERPAKAHAEATLGVFSYYCMQGCRQRFLPIYRPLSLHIPKMAAKTSMAALDIIATVIVSCKNVKIISGRNSWRENHTKNIRNTKNRVTQEAVSSVIYGCYLDRWKEALHLKNERRGDA
ncbi:MAG: hypothetical protein RBR49_11260 [Desulfovibrio desulfuricans]|nr:hypothetical protein [Desulfovibrio desulfuricans]